MFDAFRLALKFYHFEEDLIKVLFIYLFIYLLINHLSPLQGLSTPTTQIPICLSVQLPLLLLLIILPEVGLEEDACADVINFVDKGNEKYT
jgi:hypothetical protein